MKNPDGVTDDVVSEEEEQEIEDIWVDDDPQEQDVEGEGPEQDSAPESEPGPEPEGEIEEEAEQTGEEGEQSPEQPLTPQEKLAKHFTQDELNELFGKARIENRELQSEVRRLEDVLGIPLKDATNYIVHQQAEQISDEYGVPQEQAKKWAQLEAENKYLKTNLYDLGQQSQAYNAMMQYNNEKAQHVHKPVVKRYEAEIDKVAADYYSRTGQQLSFQAAKNWVLGQKAETGELSQKVRTTTQQQTLKNTQKRSQVAPEGAGAGGAPSLSIPNELAEMASAFGLTPKETREAAKDYHKTRRR